MTTVTTPMVETFTFRGQPALRLTTKAGAQAIISLFGAQVLSWIPAGKSEQLYLSPQAIFDRKTPIRGGIPICFPQFSDAGPLPQHGLLRTREWQLTHQKTDQNGRFALAVLRCQDDEHSRRLWPHTFQVELSVAIEAERLDIELEAQNTGTTPFAFTTALHTYLNVAEVEHCRLEGLYGLHYSDKTKGGVTRQDTGDSLIIEDETDRIYYNLSRPLLLRTPHGSIGIHTEHFSDAVVWNPWETRCATLSDLPATGFRRFICVESAKLTPSITLKPDESWWGRQTLLAL